MLNMIYPAISLHLIKTILNMKKSIHTPFTLLFILMGTSLLLSSGCKSPETKVEEALDKVQDAREDLTEAKQEANDEILKAASEEEWKVFESETEFKIKESERQIEVLKDKVKSEGKKMDAEISKQIDNLEFKIRELKDRVTHYEKTRTDYAAFKREFNHDMDALASALNNLMVNNKL